MDLLEGTFGRVYEERGRLYTVSSNPGRRVYGERLLSVSGREYREWDPRRSKLSAYLKVGGRTFPFRRDSHVLYLGASSGTTPSHVADICDEGRVYCVEIAPRMFRELVSNSGGRSNMMPILGDATDPDTYSAFVEKVDVVYQDVAQKRQADIACDNMEAFSAPVGMVALKTRSEDVTSDPKVVLDRFLDTLGSRGYAPLEVQWLGSYEKDHAMVVFERCRFARYGVFRRFLRRRVPHGP
ncbi:MAG: fibrillarin-like rRNA/tRNA 2'-O-methyltransferase [Candidatus Methanomethylophilaceae archaeon]|nr:fibrillarin-like rRNA/tRNA 2'-O-methyltransferase [Candidatus Methanomethylophilaceae archaeon]